MSITWSAYKRARRRSRQAWAILGLAAVTIIAGLSWFFTTGQFNAAEPWVAGPSEAPVFDPAWMKPIRGAAPVAAAKATDALERLQVKGRAAKTDYARTAFGQAWADADRNGCDTRNDILRRDLSAVEFTEGSSCKVAAGSFHEPYTGVLVSFQRGQDTSAAVQIDHVVALADAWQKGAQQLTVQQRQMFANDPLNLIAADGPANVKKGAGDAATWLPANKNFRCHYVARQISVKAAYKLWVTQAEKDAMKGVLSSCPEQQTIYSAR
ncbi:HNH endonuclease family protein [Paenarthrobacter aurescens]|uniref:HNH endonuclease family protein n=1 Tax=Paenarthrobacter aurescens TaxID=43663 RepID=UPI0021BECE27|nr:HNH endonuclease family protein [Paenarthrobacter aurescens]MCT9867747.1 HNH endonuclease family protein [Paenarthrobacter aurescens]